MNQRNQRKLLVGVGLSTVAGLTAIVVCLAVLFIASIFCTPVSAQSYVGQMPADVTQVLKEAVRIERADPPIDLAFLFEVKSDKDFQAYMETYYVPVTIKFGDIFIQYNYGDSSIFLSTQDEQCVAFAICNNDGPFLDTANKGYCVNDIENLLRGHRQSEFWPLLKAEVQKHVPSGHKK